MALRTCDQLLSCIFFFYLLFHINAPPCSSRSLITPPAPVPSKTYSPVTSFGTQISPLASLQSTLLGANKGMHANGISELKKHLSKLGYMDTTNSNLTYLDLFDLELESALKKYQLYFKLNITGILDSQTVSKLLVPRCGMADHLPHKVTEADTGTELFTFSPNKPKWPAWKRHLTYDFAIGTRIDVLSPIAVALEGWARVSEFTFQRGNNYDQADIKMSFRVGDHGDRQPFDGPGGIVAHAFPPPRGIIHFDGAENWVDGVECNRIDIQTVVAHELGHVLGLAHSSDPDAVMYPYVNPGERRSVAQDDIDGIHALYEN